MEEIAKKVLIGVLVTGATALGGIVLRHEAMLSGQASTLSSIAEDVRTIKAAVLRPR